MAATSNTPNLPATDELNNKKIVQNIFDHLEDYLETFEGFIDIFSLKAMVQHVIDPPIEDPETQLRLYLKAFRNASAFKEAFEKLDTSMQKRIEDFIAGAPADKVSDGFHLIQSPATQEHLRVAPPPSTPPPPSPQSPKLSGFRKFNGLRKLRSLRKSSKASHQAVVKTPVVYEDAAKTKVMEVHTDTPFENWGMSVTNTPRYTFVPTTVLGLQNLVLYATENHKRVRVSGYRHSWSPIFSENGDNYILVSLLKLKTVTSLPDYTPLFPMTDADMTELNTIELSPNTLENGNRVVRVGVAVTNEQFRRWAVANKSWALPMDVILVEVTAGGVNGPICHGAGRRHKTISDQVRAIEYVDAHGKLQVISDPELLKAAAGCFGLLGIVTHISLELDPMSYAIMNPSKPAVELAVPPLSLDDVPKAIRNSVSEAELLDATRQFEKDIADNYYYEVFWFPYQKKAWLNTWNTVTDSTGAKEYPETWGVWVQWLQGWLGGVITSTQFFGKIPGPWQAWFLANLTMYALPPGIFAKEQKEIKTFLPDALHFRRGIQNMRVTDMEFEIEIPGKPDDPDTPDFSIVQRAWWDVIKLVYKDYEEKGKCPMRLTLEMRIMGGSDIIMAPQRGNKHGTCSIEVLSIPDSVSDKEWQPFCQEVAQMWMSYDSHYQQKVRSVPHWAKGWDGLRLQGMPARDYLRDVAYKDALPEFRSTLESIGSKQGWTVQDLKKRFFNGLWDELLP